MAILLWLLAMVAWAACGVLAEYLIGVSERLRITRFENGEGAVILFGPLSLILVVFVITVISFADAVTSFFISLPKWSKRLRDKGRGF